MEETDSLRIAGLRLPHVPLEGDDRPPSIRILVAADIDLPSASALAEYTLEQQDRLFQTNMLDMCVVCGPFCRDGDLLAYTQRRPRNAGSKDDTFEASLTRTREETAGLEGLFTASLSQLESIVCRVLYIPGVTDPLSTLIANPNKPKCPYKRLTPNSRNIHRQWLPIVPGLGCAGLTFLGKADKVDSAAPRQNALGESSDEEDDPPNGPQTDIAQEFMQQQERYVAFVLFL